MDDWELLQEYAQRGSEGSFRELVNRHLGLVYSAALRQVNDPALAEEICQAVFILLARKAGSFRQGTVLTGWLFSTTRFVASRTLRGELRRRRREQEALVMQQANVSEGSWQRIAPELDDALEKLGESERNAVLLRFFEDKNHRQVGAALGISEEAAKKRVNRGLEKLRSFFTGRGFTISTAMLGSLMLAHAIKLPPAGLLESVVSATKISSTATSQALEQIPIRLKRIRLRRSSWCILAV